MEIRNNVLRQYLRNVYFITGTPCGGKTTVSRLLSDRYGYPVYDVDAVFDRHRELGDSLHQPAMHQTFADADAFFMRPVEEYRQWLVDNTREQLDFILLDLIRLSEKQRIFCALHLSPEEAAWLTVPERIVFLLRDPANFIEEYCNRKDHADFRAFIESATDGAAAKENCGKTLEALNRGRYEAIKRSEYFWLEREGGRTPAETAALAAAHFGLAPYI